MPTRVVTIINRKGLHARSAAKLVAVANQYDCQIELTCEGKNANCHSVMALMMLAAGLGKELHIATCGDNADQALEAICSLIESGFEELDEDTP
ncbi:HPr family phosphocarrier protein [Gilvimarinus agarilyticus]|uniref:HPr family phosphocarrier protein n=1 Tax=unclassified Gilvimarinus TaxID=2642066 RepID=UPI001C0847EC|nr:MULTISPECIES: HPr family phosphocarrier protein [unclassified Gilvimarinus]MBU2885437.1 HPr family phosphocarrier protein [Gilvimarinus agarilyticus]MDO6570337.1 HPr family phosphocarrier protein [Gilvimarinus sp. 2_MG-2023]MDO6746876.1 HPr family phosphocarrier protein [Gilvimarinus sp. 1_MG-2023]